MKPATGDPVSCLALPWIQNDYFALAIKRKGHVFKSHLRDLPVDFVPLVECVSKLQPLSLRRYVASLCLSYRYHCKCATSLSDLLG